MDSPDPLTLPSSPLAARSTRASSAKPLAQRPSNAYSSPSKSFALETGDQSGVSPWRIKVTVEAEPTPNPGGMMLGSPAKRRPARRTQQVALKQDDAMSEAEITRPRVQRKRKGTPVRGGGRRTRTTARDEPTTDDAALMPPPPLPTSSATKARRRRSLMEVPAERGNRRLSQAREELDIALEEAVGSGAALDSDDEQDEVVYSGNAHAAGDMTVLGDEDFTMVSVETLQSMRADTSLVSRRGGGEGDRSGVSVSYLPSSPPKQQSPQRARVEEPSVWYPDLSSEARRARADEDGKTYDAMSWKPTHPTPESTLDRREEERLESESSEWRRAREAVGKRIEEAGATQASIIEDAMASAGEDEEQHAKGGDAEDIWQEVSRSFESEEVSEVSNRRTRASRRTRQPAATAPTGPASAAQKVDDLFGGQVEKPRRAKIPRTWRRKSGADFHYSDSPAHVEPLEVRKTGTAENGRKRDVSTGGESRASSGVLTPPSSEDGNAHHQPNKLMEDFDPDEDQNSQEEADVDFTRPDAEATPFQPRHPRRQAVEERQQRREQIASPFSDDSSSGVTSPENEDTGMFWQTAMPQVYTRQRPERPRPQRAGKKAMELSELLDLHKTSSPAKQAEAPAIRTHVRVQQANKHSPLHMRPVEGKIKTSADGERAVSSPLRRSLLKSSKLGGSPVGKAGARTSMYTSHVSETVVEKTRSEVEESWASKASDQRQLLREVNAPRAMPKYQHQQQEAELDDATALSAEHEQESASYEEASYAAEGEAEEDSYMTEDPSRSYEERLNVESPQKIKVRFGDSENNSSLLAPKREYAPLFAPDYDATNWARKQAASPPTITLVSKKSSQQQQQGPSIFSRLSTNFWSAVVRPTGPTSISLQSPPECAPYPAALRTNLRSRYGVLASTHPWTLAHMRTLHRMLNSCTSGKADTIIPRPGMPHPDIPAHLRQLVGSTQRPMQGKTTYAFGEQHALDRSHLPPSPRASTYRAGDGGGRGGGAG